MNILCVIPCRLNATRLPKKPLLPIKERPMVLWTYENAKHCKDIAKVIVATDSEAIAKVVKAAGGEVEMTSPDIATGTERVAQVAERYPEMDVVINLQGDEPFIKPAMLSELVRPYLQGESPCMTTLAYPLAKAKYSFPSAVKVITNLQHNAIYFSRSPIPYFRHEGDAPVYNHMGLYAFKREFLLLYPKLSATPLEKAEGLEQLRVLEHGYPIRVCYTHEATLEVNTPEEYKEAQSFAENYSM